MLFETVIKILDKGKAENVDLLTAKDMLFAENPDNKDILNEASAVIREAYDEITRARRDGETEPIKKACERFIIRKENAKKKLEEKND